MGGLSLEAFVLALCIGDYNCSQASKAYYYSRPQIKQGINTVKRDLNYYIGEEVAYVAPAVFLLSTGHKAQIRLTKNWSLQWGQDVRKLVWAYNF